MRYRPLPIGISDFAEMIEQEYYYVDKTPMIRDLLEHKAKVTLFTRPRRFGKMLNMSMFKYFFEDDRNSSGEKTDHAQLFQGLSIMRSGEEYLRHMGNYPVINLTLKSAKQPAFESAYGKLKKAIADEFQRHQYILENERIVDLLSQDEIMTITVMESKGTQSVRILSDMESCVAKHQNTYCYSADSREVAPAHGHGMSCGKYRAFLELQKFYPDITPEEIQGMSMREIQNLTDEMLKEKGEQHHGEDTGDEREPYAGNGLEDERQKNNGTEREDKETISSDGHHRHRHRGTGNKHGSFMKRGVE